MTVEVDLHVGRGVASERDLDARGSVGVLLGADLRAPPSNAAVPMKVKFSGTPGWRPLGGAAQVDHVLGRIEVGDVGEPPRIADGEVG